MNAVSSIALSGLQAAQSQVQVSGHNIANTGTAGFRRQQVAAAAVPSGGVTTAITQAAAGTGSLEDDLVGLLQARNSFLANLAVFRTSDRMAGSLLDTLG